MLKILSASNFKTARSEDFERFAAQARELNFPETELESHRMEEEKAQWELLANLPLHLRYRDFIICNRGRASFQPQRNVFMPGNSVVQLLNVQGVMDIGLGKGYEVGPNGAFLNGQERRQTHEEFVMQKADAFGLLIGNSNVVLLNAEAGEKGSSVGSPAHFWMLTANDGGKCMTAFNDENDDNKGMFTATLRIWRPQDFMKQHAQLFKK